MNPWIETREVEDAMEVLQNGADSWSSLDGEEREGTVVEALYILEEAADK